MRELARMGQAVRSWFRWREALLLRWATILGALVMVTGVGVLAVYADWEYVLIAAAAPLFLPVLLRLDLAPAVILATAAFVRFSLSTGTESSLVASLVMTIMFAGAWVVRMFAVDRRLHLQPSAVNFPLLGFVVLTMVSLVWSFSFRDPLVVTWSSFPLVQVASTVVMIMLPGAFLLVANHVNNLDVLKAMVGLLLLAGLLGLVKQWAGIWLPIATDGLFTMWVIALAVGLAFFDRRISWVWRGALLTLAGAWVYWGFGRHISWVAGWLPGFVALGVLSFMRSKKLLLLIVIVAIVYVGINAEYYMGSVFEAERAESGNTRLAAWNANWRVTGKHWLFGTGPGGYAAYYMSYFPNDAMATHNNYIDVLAQTGVIGLGFCVWFFFGLAWLGYKLCVRLRGRGDFLEGLANAALAGTAGAIVAMAFGDWLFPFAYTQTIAGFDHAVYSWLFMGTIVVLDRLSRNGSGATGDV
jgi:hypothetical protein